VADPVLVYPPKKELLKQAQSWEYDSDHSLEEIAEILGTSVGSSSFYNSVRWVDDELIPLGKKLENVRGQGYRVIKPDEHVRMSNTKVNKAKKFVHIGMMISANANRKKMDERAKKLTDEHTLSLSRTYSMLETESRPLAEIEQQMVTRQLRTEKPKVLLGE
jgi:hypothetical protein